jgi:hypothetical protein
LVKVVVTPAAGKLVMIPPPTSDTVTLAGSSPPPFAVQVTVKLSLPIEDVLSLLTVTLKGISMGAPRVTCGASTQQQHSWCKERQGQDVLQPAANNAVYCNFLCAAW